MWLFMMQTQLLLEVNLVFGVGTAASGTKKMMLICNKAEADCLVFRFTV